MGIYKNNELTTNIKLFKMLEHTFQNLDYNKLNIVTSNGSWVSSLKVLTIKHTFIHNLNIFFYRIGNSILNIKNVVLLYKECCNIKNILDFLSVFNTYSPSIICSGGLIYYNIIKMNFIYFKSKFKQYHKHLILKQKENL